MGALTKLFFKGLAAFLPLVLTIALVVWLAQTAENLFRQVVEWMGLDYYWGMGIAMAVVLTCSVGLLMYSYLAQWIYNRTVGLIQRIPMVKTIYGMLKDMMGFFAHSEKKAFNQVVMVQAPDEGLEVMGLVTRTETGDLPGGVGGSDKIAVYVPMSYQLGGFLCLVDKSRVRAVDMPMEDALRFVLTAGVTTGAGKTGGGDG